MRGHPVFNVLVRGGRAHCVAGSKLADLCDVDYFFVLNAVFLRIIWGHSYLVITLS